MALNIKGKKCPVCTSYLFEEDDIVFCPICGAPHHRDCYNSVGHCGLEAFHGTDEQYDCKKDAEPEPKAQAVENDTDNSADICHACKNKLEPDMKVCPYCGRPRMIRVFTIDALGGVPADTDLGEGVTAKEAKDMVGSNSGRYILKFASGRKVSFNWMAFFIPGGWFLSRKMYKFGILATTLLVASQLCLVPMLKVLEPVAGWSASDMSLYLMQNIGSVGVLPLALSLLSGAVNVAVRVLSGIFGDYIYKKSVIEKCKRLKAENADKIPFIAKHGGVNLIAGLIGIFVFYYLPNIIVMFL